jgi:hypothetical protein
LGIGDWGLGPIPNPQSPIPNPHQLKMYFYKRTFGPKILDDVKSLLSTYSNYVNIKTDTFEFILHIYEIFLDSKVCKTFEEAKYNNLMNSPLKNIYICREKAITEYKSFLKNKLNYYDRDGFLACVASKGMGKTRFIHECQKMTYEDEQFNDFIVVVTSFNASSGYMDIETDFNNEWSLNSLNLRIVWNLITKNNNNFQKFARIWLLCFTEWETDDLLDKILKYYKKSKMAIMIDELTQMKPSKIENYANKFFKWIKQKLLYKDSPFYVCVTSLTELGAIQLKEMKTSSDRPFKLAVLNPLETSNIEIINLFNKIDFIKDKKLNNRPCAPTFARSWHHHHISRHRHHTHRSTELVVIIGPLPREDPDLDAIRHLVRRDHPPLRGHKPDPFRGAPQESEQVLALVVERAADRGEYRVRLGLVGVPHLHVVERRDSTHGHRDSDDPHTPCREMIGAGPVIDGRVPAIKRQYPRGCRPAAADSFGPRRDRKCRCRDCITINSHRLTPSLFGDTSIIAA